MPNNLRLWTCRNCGRSNTTEIGADGTVQCEHCSRRMSIQPSRARGGESARQRSDFERRAQRSSPQPTR